MICPNCKNELMNVNGRYVCIECGSEVPEDKVIHEADPTVEPVINQEVQAPVETVVTEENVIENNFDSNNLLENQDELNKNVIQEAENLVVKNIAPVENQLAETVDVSLNQVPDIEILPTNSEAITPVQTQVLGENIEEQLSPTLDTEGEGIVDIKPQEPEMISTENLSNVEPITENAAAETSVEINQIQPRIETETVPVSEGLSTPELPQSVLEPEIKAEPAQPIDPFEVADKVTSNNDSQIDPNLVAPNFPVPDEQFVNQEVQATPTASYTDNRKLYFLIAGGVVALLLLVSGGIYSYSVLTRPAKVELLEEDNSNWTDYNGDTFLISFPSTPEKSKETISLNLKKITLDKTSTEDGGNFAISYSQIPDEIKVSEDLTELLDFWTKATLTEIESKETTNFEGYYAVNFTGSQDGVKVKGRVLNINKRVYYIYYLGDNFEDYSKFVNSFQLVEETSREQ